MGISVGGGIGPVRVSARVRLPAGGKPDPFMDSVMGACMVVGIALGIVWALGYGITMAPLWAFEAAGGRWGITIMVLGYLGLGFLFLGPLIKNVGAVPLFSWLMFALYQTHWWHLFAELSSTSNHTLVGHKWDSIDHYVVNILGFLVYLAFMALLLMPVLATAFLAFTINAVLVGLRSGLNSGKDAGRATVDPTT